MRGGPRRALDRITGLVIAHGRGLAIAIAVFVAAAVAFRWARLSAGFWTIDDAGITYAASFELADHGSLAAYVEGPPVESYSNPLVFFVGAALRALGWFDPIVSHVRIEMVLFAAMVVFVWSLLRRVTGELAAVLGAGLFTAMQLIATATWVWYGSGLENVWVATGLVMLLWLCVRTARGVALPPAWGVAAALVAITRPEAPVYVAGFYLALAACARPPGRSWRAHARVIGAALAVTALLYAGFLCWRRVSYGDWVPNTYYAKFISKPQLAHNLRVAVLDQILLNARTWLVASAALALAFVPRFRWIAAMLAIFALAALALPISVGEDWGMGGGRRFSTPFLAVAHVAFALLAAVCVVGLGRGGRRGGRIAAAAGLLAIAFLSYRLLASRARRAPVKLLDVTLGHIGAGQGGQRWEHQMRLGVPYGVTMIPDAGGSLLVGGMQMIDNAYLADFAMAHMGRYFGGDPALLRQVNQYEHEERRPDLVDSSQAVGVIDPAYIGTRYLAGAGHLHARRDLVEVAAVDAGARLLFDDGQVQVYLSDETVLTAAPGALVRCELIVAWREAAIGGELTIRGAVTGGDRDEISLRPYLPGPSGIERRALLLGAPGTGGPAAVTLELVRGERVVARQAIALDVVADDAGLGRAAEQILAAPGSAMQAARRLGWLREQAIPRFGMTRFHGVLDALVARNAAHGSRAGESLLELRWNARLASFAEVPAGIRAAEVVIARRVIAMCPATGTATGTGTGTATGSATGTATATATATAIRVACLGRAVDELRRLGYLGVVARVPELGEELARAREGLGRLPLEEQYRTLVGLTLADASVIALQRELISVRRAIERYPALPSVPGAR